MSVAETVFALSGIPTKFPTVNPLVSNYEDRRRILIIQLFGKKNFEILCRQCIGLKKIEKKKFIKHNMKLFICRKLQGSFTLHFKIFFSCNIIYKHVESSLKSIDFAPNLGLYF